MKIVINIDDKNEIRVLDELTPIAPGSTICLPVSDIHTAICGRIQTWNVPHLSHLHPTKKEIWDALVRLEKKQLVTCCKNEKELESPSKNVLEGGMDFFEKNGNTWCITQSILRSPDFFTFRAIVESLITVVSSMESAEIYHNSLSTNPAKSGLSTFI